jgi:hypothetical protein
MSFKHTALALAALCASAAASAQVGVTADLGSTGIGAHVVVPFTSNLNARFGANGFHHNFNETSGGVDYDIHGKLQTFDVLLDWYVRTGGSFHLTGGLVYNGNRFTALAKPNQLGKFRVNGSVYNGSDVGVLDGQIDYRKAAPYLGIGWGNPVAADKGWGFHTDLGAFYQGSPNVQLESTGCRVAQALCTMLARDVAAERVRLGEDTDKLKFYPVVRIGLSYRF